MKAIQKLLVLVFVVTAVFIAACRPPQPSVTLTVVTTTSTQDSGLLERLMPAAEKSLGLHIKVIAVGSGEALKYAERGEADVVLAHSPAAEEKVVAAGHLVDRAPLMWNRFFIVGPESDPATISGLADPVDAFKRIRAAGVMFVSRGDESGTHKKEQELWRRRDWSRPLRKSLPRGKDRARRSWWQASAAATRCATRRPGRR